MIGTKFGRLTVIRQVESLGKRARYECNCACGGAKVVFGKSLRSGNTRSCGCLHKEQLSAMKRTHGKSGTPEYKAWWDMMHRCYNSINRHFKDYGGRGIVVCDRWRESFEMFLEDMGFKPSPELTLDRRNNDGNYEPGNCRWATQKEQSSNKRYLLGPSGIRNVKILKTSYEVSVRRKYIGRFKTLPEAIKAAEDARNA